MSDTTRYLPEYKATDMRRALESVWQTPGVLFPLHLCRFTIAPRCDIAGRLEGVYLPTHPATGARVGQGFGVAAIPLPDFKSARLWAFPGPQKQGKK